MAMSVITCPYCKKNFNHHNTIQQTLTPHPPITEPIEIHWEPNTTKTGNNCEKAFLNKNSYRGYPTQAYINQKRTIELYLEQDTKPVFGSCIKMVDMLR
jgi:uncharacterized protein YbaR (Trm112 family)